MSPYEILEWHYSGQVDDLECSLIATWICVSLLKRSCSPTFVGDKHLSVLTRCSHRVQGLLWLSFLVEFVIPFQDRHVISKEATM